MSRAIRDAVGFFYFQPRDEAVANPLVQECGSGKERLGLQLQDQAGRFALVFGHGFTGWNVGSLGHG